MHNRLRAYAPLNLTAHAGGRAIDAAAPSVAGAVVPGATVTIMEIDDEEGERWDAEMRRRGFAA